MTDSGGPYLTAALICERVLAEQDSVLSAIRIIDRLVHRRAGADVPDDLPEFQHTITILIMLKSGKARGRHKLSLRIEKPSGEPGPQNEWSVLFEGEDRGVNLVVQTVFQPDQEGLYWFDLYLGQQRLTRMPLRVIYEPFPNPGRVE